MATMLRRAAPGVRLFSLFGLLLLLLPAVSAAVLQPLDGSGNFHSYVDVINRWESEERLDVLVLVEIVNGDLKCKSEKGGLVGRVGVEIVLEGPDGVVVRRKRSLRTAALSAADASSRTLHQVFGVVLENVPFRRGRFECTVTDVNRRRLGLVNEAKHRNARSECATDWYAEESPRPAFGIALEEPLFLLHAPLGDWNPANAHETTTDDGWLHDYAHASRRFGLEQDRLQVFLPVWPASGGIREEADLSGLRVQVNSQDMDFVLSDSVRFDARGRAALVAGRPAGLFYELDVNLLPEGIYQMSLAPLAGRGRGRLVEFSVVWRMDALSRHQDLVLGEGRTVFSGRRLDDFLDASPVLRQTMLDEFWDALNPAPENPVNEAHLEFQYRVAYVQKFLGGFDSFGARDGRGEVFLLLGPPDEVQRNPMPNIYRERNDARNEVYDDFAVDREASSGEDNSGDGDINPYSDIGGIRMPDAFRSDQELRGIEYTTAQGEAFEFWKYDEGGDSLFVNRLSNKGMGQRFLFIDRMGTGDYELDSLNIVQGED